MMPADAGLVGPAEDGVGGILRAVVADDHVRAPALSDDSVQLARHTVPDNEVSATRAWRWMAPSRRVSLLLGRWRIVQMTDGYDEFSDMMEPAYIPFGDHGLRHRPDPRRRRHRGGRVPLERQRRNGQGAGRRMAKLRQDGSLEGQICFQGGEKPKVIARRWIFSTSC